MHDLAALVFEKAHEKYLSQEHVAMLEHMTPEEQEATFQKEIRKVLCINLGVILFGAVVIGHIEHWSAVDSFYWACVTATTVGYAFSL